MCSSRRFTRVSARGNRNEISYSLLMAAIAACVRATRAGSRQTEAGAQRQGRRSGRFHGLLGIGGHRRLALADGHPGGGRFRGHSLERRRPQSRQRLGSGEGRSRGRTVPGLWSTRGHANSGAGCISPGRTITRSRSTRTRARRHGCCISAESRRPGLRPHGRATPWRSGNRRCAVWDRHSRGWGRRVKAIGDDRSKWSPQQIRPGYLRKNGPPYSGNTVLKEFFDLSVERNGDPWFVVTTIVEDPQNLREPFVTSTNFKKQKDAAGFSPTACSSR